MEVFIGGYVVTARSMLLIGLLLLFLAALSSAQDAPKPKKVYLYKVVMTCPSGKTLWARYQDGLVATVPGSNLLQMRYRWYQ